MVTATARTLSRGEIAADGVVHAVGLTAGLAGAATLIAFAAISRHPGEVVTASIYAFGLLAMLGCSAAYSLGHRLRYRELLRRLDHAAIFVMIAGTYTPFTVLALHGVLAVTLTVAVWAIAAIGIAAKLMGLANRPVALWTGLYVAFGWIGVLAAEPFLATLTVPVLALLVAGGLIYTVGVVFFGLQRMRYQRAVWHGFVLAAASVHFSAVFGMMATSG
jgi:hemolysin III